MVNNLGEANRAVWQWRTHYVANFALFSVMFLAKNYYQWKKHHESSTYTVASFEIAEAEYEILLHWCSFPRYADLAHRNVDDCGQWIGIQWHPVRVISETNRYRSISLLTLLFVRTEPRRATIYQLVLRFASGQSVYTLWTEKNRGSTFDIITLEKHARFL